MEERSPTIRADAVLVSRLIGGRYTSWPKEVARRRILRGLRDVDPQLVLDLWGGGGSARAMTEAGLSVLSVDDGRAFDDHGVTSERGRRALEVLGQIDGYQTAFGEATGHASTADAAFLDFMGHWAPDKKRVLVACRHMKAVAVTLMPEPCRKEHERTRGRAGLTKKEYQQRYARPPRIRSAEEKAENVRRQRERYANDPEYREMKKRCSREYSQRKKLAAVSGTTAEAILEDAA